MNEIEAQVSAAVEVLKQSAYKDDWTTEEVVVEMFQAAFVARVGCDQCGGRGWLRNGEAMHGVGPVALEDTSDCPADHVELVNPYGGTVWADPAKVKWRCENWFVQFRTLYEGLTYERVELREFRMPCLPDSPHGESNCRWVPRPMEADE